MRTHLFVYGTLMKDFANHRVMVELGAERVGAARTAQPRTLVDLGPYPALLPASEERDVAARPVEGELYAIPEHALAELDRFEGAPELYRRERVAVEAGGERLEACTYVLARRVPARARVLASGRYDQRGTELEAGVTEEQIAGEDEPAGS